MATTLKQGVELLNETLKRTGYEYQIDTTNDTTMVDGLKVVGAYSPSQQNKILDQMNAILIFRNYGTMFTASKNPTRLFWRDFVNYGGGIEDIYHKVIEAESGYWAEDFDGSDDDAKALAVAKDLVSYKKEDLAKKFHTDMSGFRLKISKSDLEISQVFTPEGITSYIDVTMANLSWSAELKLQNCVIDCMKQMVSDGKVVFKGGFDLNSENGVTTFVETTKMITDSMTKNVTDAFNYANIETISDVEDMFLVTTPELINRIETRGYANAFNLKYYRDNNKLVILPYGATLGYSPDGEPVLALLIDKRTIVMALRYWNMMPKVVENTDYINYFLKVRYLHGYNEFFNAVALCGGEVADFFGDTTKSTLLDADTYSELSNVLINGEPLSIDSKYYLTGSSESSYHFMIPFNAEVTLVGSESLIGFIGTHQITFPMNKPIKNVFDYISMTA